MMRSSMRSFIWLVLITSLAALGPSAQAADPTTNGTAPDVVANRLPGYDVLASAGTGRTLFMATADTQSAKQGVLRAVHDLARVFDAKPAIEGAFGDERDKQCYSSFSAKQNGQAVKGFVVCGIGERGAAITVVYNRVGAPVQDTATLMAALPVPSKWVTHQLPGGSGVIQLPPEWKLTQSTTLGSVVAEGPNGQNVGLGIGAEVVDPNSFIAAQVRAAGTMLVAPYSDPVTALKNLAPQLSQMSQRKGGPALQLDKIISTSPAKAQLPNGQAAWILSRWIKVSNGKSEAVRELSVLECYPVGNLAWGLYASYGSGPEATFDRDLVTMMQIAKTWKLNNQMVMNNSQQMINAQNRSFAAFEQSMKAKNDAFDRYMQSVRNSEVAREKSNADFDEIIRGYRAVEDTATGNRSDVD
ncbi:MAG: hypothetical protein ACREIC_13650, partial [Limisphaerales bacterium]